MLSLWTSYSRGDGAVLDQGGDGTIHNQGVHGAVQDQGGDVEAEEDQGGDGLCKTEVEIETPKMSGKLGTRERSRGVASMGSTAN